MLLRASARIIQRATRAASAATGEAVLAFGGFGRTWLQDRGQADGNSAPGSIPTRRRQDAVRETSVTGQ